MKKIGFLRLMIGLIFSSTMFTSCYRVTPNAGEEAVLVQQPIIFGDGGVDETPVSTGSEWCATSTDSKIFKITPVTFTEEFQNMAPADNTPVSFSAYLKTQIRKGQTPTLYNLFGADWYQNSLQASFRTMVRDKVSAYKMFDLFSKREISAQLEKAIFADIEDYAKKLNIPVDILQVSIGAITPPDQVLTETKNTAAQNQSSLTQDARAKAELTRRQAEENKAIADKAYMKEMNMTIEQYIHIRQLEIEKEKVELIKDNKNATVIFGQSVPFSYPVK